MTRCLERVCVGLQATVGEILKTIDDNGLGVALIVDGERRLLGMVTDGDVRRALLHGHGLSTRVADVMNRDPVVAQEGTPNAQVFELMDVQIRHVPVLDERRRVCDLVCYDDLSKRIPWALPSIGSAEESEVAETVRSTWLTMGPKVQRLEREVAAYVGVKHGIAVSSGTAALDVALKALGIGPGEEVIVPAFTYIATANAVVYQHAVPVLADVEPETFNLDPEDVARRLTPKTRGVMPIDYGGQAADYDALMRIAKAHGLHLIEDGAQSLGGAFRGRPLCSFGEISTVSFHAAKIITSVEGGMVLTNNDALAERARIIRNQGEDPTQKYLHPLLGHNYRMTDLHAAVGLTQFGRLREMLRRRAEIAAFYTAALSSLGEAITVPIVKPGNTPAWFFYPILVERRDEVARYLKTKGIDTRIAWPLPIHQQPYYQRRLGGALCYPVAERIAATVLNLPLYVQMSEEELKYVVVHLRDAIERTRMALA